MGRLGIAALAAVWLAFGVAVMPGLVAVGAVGLLGLGALMRRI